MWRLCVWLLGLFRRRKKTRLVYYLDAGEYPPTDKFCQYLSDVHEKIYMQHQETWEKEATPIEMVATGEYRTSEPRKLQSPLSLKLTYDPIIRLGKWEVAKLHWPDGSVQWMVFWNIPEWPTDGGDPLFYHHSVHESEEIAEKVAADLNKPPADPTGGDH